VARHPVPAARRRLSRSRLRHHLAALSGRDPDRDPQGAITYQLRRLRLHGGIDACPNSFRYRVTEFGLPAALFHALYNRLLRPGLAAALPTLRASTPAQRAFRQLNIQVQAWIDQAIRCLKLDTFSSCVLTQAGLEFELIVKRLAQAVYIRLRGSVIRHTGNAPPHPCPARIKPPRSAWRVSRRKWWVMLQMRLVPSRKVA